jgi:hypothetical protein
MKLSFITLSGYGAFFGFSRVKRLRTWLDLLKVIAIKFHPKIFPTISTMRVEEGRFGTIMDQGRGSMGQDSYEHDI